MKIAHPAPDLIREPAPDLIRGLLLNEVSGQTRDAAH